MNQDEDRYSRMSILSNCQSDDFDNQNLTNFEQIMKNNRQWSKNCIEKQKDYFKKLVKIQAPKYLWLGCADSRVPANEIMGLKPGQVFVHRNIANIMPPSDINVLACIQYAVQHLGVQQIIVAGHYGCGGVKAAFEQSDFGALQAWLSHIRQIRKRFKESLLGSQTKKQRTLVELNVRQQVRNVARIAVVQKAWKQNKKLSIHGVVYSLEDGILRDLGVSMRQIQDLPQQYRITGNQTS